MCETTSVTWRFLQPFLQPFLVHSGEVRHKIVGQKKVTLENKKFNILVYLRDSSVIYLLYFIPYFVSKYLFEYLISWY